MMSDWMKGMEMGFKKMMVEDEDDWELEFNKI